jgi:hypothetical protein
MDFQEERLMVDHLAAAALLQHVRVLAEGIGPRPAGSLDEAAARRYIWSMLQAAGITQIEEQRFSTPNTWGYALAFPTAVALIGNGLGGVGRLGKLMGGVLSLASTYALWRAMGGHRQLFVGLAPRRDTANLLVRFAPTGRVQRRIVLIAHTDSNKYRPSHAPGLKRFLLVETTAGIWAMWVNGVSQVMQALGIRAATERAQRLSFLGLAAGFGVELADELGGYVDGANDNASAVACLLGLGAHLAEHPLQHAEVWLAFTGAEEVGSLGTHALLNAYGDDLADAWFIDFEMVGAPRISYVTRHSGFSYFNAYAPDADSLALAERVAQHHPELEVTGRPMVMVEEVGSLRGRGYRGLCVVGVGEDGWLANWHQYSDTLAHIDPSGLERAARFALAMLETLDAEVKSKTWSIPV